MKTIFAPSALDDLVYWQKTGNTAILKRIRLLLQSIQEDPYSGIGKPEPLKHDLSGCWSRRINKEHRIVYQITDDIINVIQVRYHY